MRPWPLSHQTDAPPWSDWSIALTDAPAGVLDALRPAVALLSDLRDLYLHDRVPSGPLLARFTPTHWLHRAGDHRSPCRRDALRQALCDLDGSIDLTAARALTDHPLLDALQAESDALRRLTLARSLLGGTPPAPDIRGEANDDLACALSWLRRHAPWEASWEVQARGVMGSGPLTASWFVRGLIRLALHRIRGDQHTAIAALLDEPPPGALRYYAPCPPDADSLGLALQLAAVLPEPPRERIEGWLAVMHRHIRDGLVPTWLGEGAVRWSGDDCPAVRLSLVCGLLAYAPQRYASLALDNLRAAIATAHRRYHYIPAYTDLLLHRALTLAPPLPDLTAAHRSLTDRLLATQQPDGGWGGVLQTACALEILAQSGADVLPQHRAMRYSGDAQRPDGAWSSAPLYAIPLPRDRVGWHSGRALSTAITAQALHTALLATG